MSTTQEDTVMSDASSTAPGATLTGKMAAEIKYSEVYTINQKLRSGSYGTVYVTTHNATGEEYAVKVIDRK
jgi:serine/threonine protein kinase